MSTDLISIQEQINHLASYVHKKKTSRLDDSLFSAELSPHYMQLASQLSKSSLVQKCYQGKPQDLFLAMALGYQIGLSVEQAIQSIAVINGKPCLWGDDMLALCMTHPDFVDIIEEPIMQAATIVGYRCTVKRKGMADHTKEFTLEMAKRAGLLGKAGPWTNYLERMLQWRARGFCLRDKFPDALKGIKSREEVEDYIEGEYSVVDKPSRSELLKNDLTHEEPLVVHTLADVSPPIITDVITDEQIETISLLFFKHDFSEERIQKAMAYYDVKVLEELSSELADHLIAQLNKL